jgi:hypothetical protein
MISASNFGEWKYEGVKLDFGFCKEENDMARSPTVLAP